MGTRRKTLHKAKSLSSIARTQADLINSQSGEAGIMPENILGTLIAIAPVIGTARVVSASGNIVHAFDLAGYLAENTVQQT